MVKKPRQQPRSQMLTGRSGRSLTRSRCFQTNGRRGGTPTLYGNEANEVFYKFLPDPTRIQPTTGVSLSDVREQSEIAMRRGLQLSWPPLRGAGIGRRLSLCYVEID